MSPERRRAGAQLGLVGSAVLLLLIVISGARAENLDAGKSGARLFADSCATCHRSARGLAKGRFRLTLYLFLQKHYTSSDDAASALSTYLQSVDAPAAAPARRPAARRRDYRGETRPPRPPLPVRGR
ncbi:cytochrome C [Bradyrhizobium sp. HKCCYLS3013]|uniref:cytochrome C n=1 Tax=Bradyrhizobium sp. HKCCYLS3013 TaxID=3420735 RepID=UPI003EBF9C09